MPTGKLVNGMISQTNTPAPKPKAKPVTEVKPAAEVKAEIKKENK